MLQTLPLDDLLLDPAVQPRAMMSRGTIAAYGALYTDTGAEALPPLIVYQDGTDLWLADGFHRVAAAKHAGLTVLPADVRPGRSCWATSPLHGTRHRSRRDACGGCRVHPHPRAIWHVGTS